MRVSAFRMIGYAALATVVIGLLTIGYIVWLAAGHMGQPFFSMRSGNYDCTDEVTGEPGGVKIDFTNDPHRAHVIFEGKLFVLSFESGGVLGDLYRNPDLELFVDPEVYVRTRDGDRLGPCA